MYWSIVIVLIILAFVFLKMSHAKHRISLIVFILVLLFFYITVSRVFTQYDIDWKSSAGMEKGIKVYFSWLGGAFGNLKTITANAIRMDWSQKNKTDTAVQVIEEKDKEK